MVKKLSPNWTSFISFYYKKKAAVVSKFCLIGKICHDFLVPTLIELGWKTFMPFQTSDLDRVISYRIVWAKKKKMHPQKGFQSIVHAIVSRTLNGSGIIHALELMTLNAMMGNYLWPGTKDGFLVLTAFSHSLASFYCTY